MNLGMFQAYVLHKDGDIGKILSDLSSTSTKICNQVGSLRLRALKALACMGNLVAIAWESA